MSSATYSLVYAFLKTNAHDKAAQALKKSVKDVVVLEESMDVDGPSLDKIVEQWQTQSTSS